MDGGSDREPGLADHVKGWVPNEALREIERTASGCRIYVEADIYWDDDTSQFKPKIVAVVNKIARENLNCGQIDTSSVAKCQRPRCACVSMRPGFRSLSGARPQATFKRRQAEARSHF